jgi:Chaperone of endosialidase
MAKYGSGSKKVTPNAGLRTSRYQYLALEDAEPNLGFTSEKVLPIKDNYYQLVSFDGGTVYDRYWQVAPAGIITGISIFDEGLIVGTGNSINKIDFRGNIITATANNFGTISTITVAPPGNDTQLIYNSSGNFAASANLTFSSNTLSVTGFGSFSQGSYNQYVRVGVESNNIIDTTNGNLVLDANSGITSIKSILLAGITTFSGSNSSNLVTLSQTGTGNALFANGTVISGLGSIGVGTTIPTQELDVNGDVRLRGTIYDYNNLPGNTGQVLVKNVLGGLDWINQSTLQTGAGGTYTNIQYQTYAGIMGGASNFVYEPINSRVGIGSTLPQYLLDVLGYSRFIGQTEIDNLRVTGVATIATLGVTGLTTTQNLIVTGVGTFATLGVTGLTTTKDLRVTGVGTFATLGVTGLTTTKDLRVTGVATIATLGVTGLTTTQNLIVTGLSTLTGARINNVYVGTTDNNTISTPTGNLILNSTGGTTQVNDILFVNDTTQTTSITDGALVVNGGTGVKNDLNVGGYVAIGGTLGVTGASRFTSNVTIDTSASLSILNTTQSTNKDTGSVTIEGGVGIENNLNVGGASSITGITTFGSNVLPFTNGTQNLGSVTQTWNTVYATTFVGRILGNADTAGYATTAGISTHLKGGSAGQIPYQSNVNTTLFTATGTQNYLLQSNSTSAPTWVNPATLNVSYADNAGIATNIKGGAGGSIPYQTSVDRTSLLANGTSGQLLQSNGGSAAPSWTSANTLSVSYALNSGIATNLSSKGLSVTGQIPWQSGNDQTSFTSGGSLGQLLAYNGTNAPIWTSPQALSVQFAGYATTAGIATNIGGGSAGVIPYQSGSNATSFTQVGTAGSILQSNGTGAPTWTSPQGLTVRFAGYATTAGIATNIGGGSAGQIPYQSGSNTTLFTQVGTAGSILQSNGTGAPTWINPLNIISQSQNSGYANTAGIATNLRGGSAGVIPYQTASGITSFTQVGTAGSILQSNGTGEPTWINPLNIISQSQNSGYANTAGIATNLRGTNVTGQIPWQSGNNQTSFTSGGTTGQLLQWRVSGGPIWVSPTDLTVQFAGYATTSGIATNIGGGSAGVIPYQSGSNATSFTQVGTAGSILQSNGTGAPTWTSPQGLTVQFAGYATTAGIATNIRGGSAGVIPYQSGLNATSFTLVGTAGSILQSNGIGAPTWINPSAAVGGITAYRSTFANYADNAGIATNIRGGSAGQIPYQTAFSLTSFTLVGTAGSILQSNGTGAPTWINPSAAVGGITAYRSTFANYADNAGIATFIKGGSAGQIPYQSGSSVTLFTQVGTAGFILSSNGTGAPTWINPSAAVGGITASKSNYADNAGIATFIKGGSAGNIPYQTSNSNTTFLASPTTNGYILQYNTISASPTWVAPTNLTVQNATNATNTSNLLSGSAGAIPYQISANSTGFTAQGSSGQVLTSGGAGAPTWTSVNDLSSGKASIATRTTNDNYYLTYVTGVGQTALYMDNDLYYNPINNTLRTNRLNTDTFYNSSTTIVGSTETYGIQIRSLGVGVVPSATQGAIFATNNITAYYSDERLKENITIIPNALSKLLKLKGVTFNSNKLAEQYGYTDKKEQVGVIAQEVEEVLPQVVVPAPFDIAQDEEGNQYSKSGKNYKTVQYDKLIPLLIEAIKEQQETIVKLQNRIEDLERK